MSERNASLLSSPRTLSAGASIHPFQLFHTCLQQSIHLLPFGHSGARCSARKRHSRPSRQGRVFHLCVMVSPFFSLPVRASACSQRKSKLPSSPLLLLTSKNSARASVDSQELWVAVALVAAPGFVSADVSFAAEDGDRGLKQAICFISSLSQIGNTFSPAPSRSKSSPSLRRWRLFVDAGADSSGDVCFSAGLHLALTVPGFH